MFFKYKILNSTELTILDLNSLIFTTSNHYKHIKFLYYAF